MKKKSKKLESESEINLKACLSIRHPSQLNIILLSVPDPRLTAEKWLVMSSPTKEKTCTFVQNARSHLIEQEI